MRRATRTICIATWLLLGYTIIPFCLLAGYNHPACDDFVFAMMYHYRSFCAMQQELYVHYGGRFFSSAVMCLNPLIYHSFSGYKVYSFLLFAGFSVALYAVVKAFFRQWLPPDKTLLVFAILLFSYNSALPSAAQCWYWFTGSFTYTFPSVAGLLYLYNTIRLLRRNGPASPGRWLWQYVLCVCLCGSNEAAMFTVSWFSLLLLIAAWQRKPGIRKQLIVQLAVVLLFDLVAVLAPGNFNRLHALPFSGNIYFAMTGGIRSGLVLLGNWLCYFFPGVLLVTVFAGDRITALLQQYRFRIVHVGIFLVLWLGLFFFEQIFFCYVLGSYGEPRIENVVCLFVLICFTGSWFMALTLFPRMQGVLRFPGRKLVAVALFLIAILRFSSPVNIAWLDLLSGAAQSYNQELNKRYARIRKDTAAICYVPPLVQVPPTISFSPAVLTDTKENREDSNRIEFAHYFGKEYIFTTAPQPSVRTPRERLILLIRSTTGLL